MVSANAHLRKSIYEIAKQSKLLNLSSRTEMEKGIKNTVDKVIEYADTSTLENTSYELDEVELKSYIEKVIHTLRKSKAK